MALAGFVVKCNQRDRLKFIGNVTHFRVTVDVEALEVLVQMDCCQEPVEIKVLVTKSALIAKSIEIAQILSIFERKPVVGSPKVVKFQIKFVF